MSALKDLENWLAKDKVEIVTFPDRRLFQQSVQVPEIPSPVWSRVKSRMAYVMRGANGVGLSGVQVGLPWRFFVVGQSDGDTKLYINPSLRSYRHHTVNVAPEGCLSLPGYTLPVDRAQQIVMDCRTIGGSMTMYSYDGMMARICLHELDHLDGVTIISRAACPVCGREPITVVIDDNPTKIKCYSGHAWQTDGAKHVLLPEQNLELAK